MIYGIVDDKGNILSGSGFSVNHQTGSGLSLYEITFANGFGNLPSVVVSRTDDTYDLNDKVIVRSIAKDKVVVRSVNFNGSDAWRGFSFIAVG
jgi:hypothetical protein